MRRLARWLFLAARSAPGRWLAGWIITHMSFAIPLKRLRESATLMAFHHPRPAYPLHILIVPKRQISGLAGLTNADADFMADLFRAAQSLAVEFDLERHGYRLIVNGGAYQDIPQLHFHLIADRLPERQSEPE